MRLGRTNQWKLGAFVVGGVALAVLCVLWLGAARFSRTFVPAVTYFDESVQGLDVGAPVKIRGVTVGEVSRIDLAPDRRQIEVRFDLYQDSMVRMGIWPHTAEGAFVPGEVRIQLVTIAITGVKILQVDFFDPELFPEREYSFDVPWNHVPSTPSMFKNLESNVRVSLGLLPGAIRRIERLAANLDGQLDALDLGGLSARAQAVLERLDAKLAAIDTERTSEELAGLLAESRAAMTVLRTHLEGLDDPEATLGGPLARLDGLLADLRAADLPETVGTVRDTSRAFGALAHDAGGLTTELHADLALLRETLAAIRELARLLERDPAVLLRGKDGSYDGDGR